MKGSFLTVFSSSDLLSAFANMKPPVFGAYRSEARKFPIHVVRLKNSQFFRVQFCK
ncbi:hypothetical protein TASCI_10124 [Tenacibaculum ascidiaceicola]